MKKLNICVIVALILTASVSITYAASEKKLSHRQEIWKAALEWCESNGDIDAINENDLDGTPSYGAFQFKPSTLNYYAKKYGVATTTVMDYEVQSAVIDQMILHRNEIKWRNEFPWCVKKLGLPPIK